MSWFSIYGVTQDNQLLSECVGDLVYAVLDDFGDFAEGECREGLAFDIGAAFFDFVAEMDLGD